MKISAMQKKKKETVLLIKSGVESKGFNIMHLFSYVPP
jgi:hypothetical protein